jgi:hypothetical protein
MYKSYNFQFQTPNTFTAQSVLRQAHKFFFQSEFFRQCDPVSPLSKFSTFLKAIEQLITSSSPYSRPLYVP